MMADVWTVMWKEWKEILVYSGGRTRLSLLLFVGVFGVYLPLQSGRAWVESPTVLAYWAWVPLFLVSSVVADSFAGERERHTLEALLATRLSDQAILVGKIGAAIGYGWGLTLVSLLLGLITVNVVHGQGELLLYPPAVGLGIILLSFLGAGLAASAGVLVSLRAATVRQAQQSLNLAVMLLLFVPIFGLQALPAEWQARLLGALQTANVTAVMAVVILILLVLDAVLFVAALTRFQRTRLILD
jgi:ABC-2 type transport system permease protein